MKYYIPDSVIVKAYEAYKKAPLPGVDAMASAINAIKGEIAELVVEEYLTQQILLAEEAFKATEDSNDT